MQNTAPKLVVFPLFHNYFVVFLYFVLFVISAINLWLRFLLIASVSLNCLIIDIKINAKRFISHFAFTCSYQQFIIVSCITGTTSRFACRPQYMSQLSCFHLDSFYGASRDVHCQPCHVYGSLSLPRKVQHTLE